MAALFKEVESRSSVISTAKAYSVEVLFRKTSSKI